MGPVTSSPGLHLCGSYHHKVTCFGIVHVSKLFWKDFQGHLSNDLLTQTEVQCRHEPPVRGPFPGFLYGVRVLSQFKRPTSESSLVGRLLMLKVVSNTSAPDPSDALSAQGFSHNALAAIDDPLRSRAGEREEHPRFGFVKHLPPIVLVYSHLSMAEIVARSNVCRSSSNTCRTW